MFEIVLYYTSNFFIYIFSPKHGFIHYRKLKSSSELKSILSVLKVLFVCV